MKKFTPILCFLLAFSLAAGGCSKGVRTASDSSGDSSIAADIEEFSSLGDTSEQSTDSSEQSQTAGTTKGNNTSKTTSAASQSNSVKKITIWATAGDDTVFAQADDFLKTHPDIFVDVQTPGDQSVSAYKNAAAAGKQPDAVIMDHVYITGLGEENLLLDLSKLGASSLKSKFVSSCWEAVTYGSKVYGIPHDGNTIAMVYNKTLLEKWTGKNTVPKTYEDLIAIDKQNNSDGVQTFTTPFFETANQNRMNWAAFNYFFWLWGNGGEILSPDNKQAVFNSAEGVRALQQIIDLVKTYKVAGDTYQESQFYNGSVGMIEMGNWCMGTITDSAQTSQYGVAMLPVLKEGVPAYSGLGLFAYGVSANSKYPAETYEFIKALCTNDDYQVQYAKQFKELPVTESALKDKYYQSDMWQTFIQQFRQSKSRPGVKNWEEIEKIISEAVKNAITSGDPKGALDAAAASVNKLL